MDKSSENTGYRAVLIVVIFLLLFCGCVRLQKRLDILSIEYRNKDFAENTDYGNVDQLRDYIETIDLESDTVPINFTMDDVRISLLDEPVLEDIDDISVIQEKIILPSSMRTGNPDIDRTVLYVFRQKELENRNVILVAPGGPMNEKYFKYICGYLSDAIRRGYDVIMYIPPYFLDRAEPENSFFTLNTRHNVSAIIQSVKEIRTTLFYLRKRRVNSVGMFGGSLGGSLVLLASLYENVDHISVMEPVVDWCYTLVKNEYFSPTMVRIKKAGFNADMLCSAYKKVSPCSYSPNQKNRNIQILYPKYDQYTPSTVMYPFSRKWNIKHFDEYERSHVTVLINDDMFQGYYSFLDSLASKEATRSIKYDSDQPE